MVAGFPSPAEQYQETPLDLNELLVKRPAATFFVKVQGDSMIGDGIRDGDLLVVDRSLRPASGDVIIACVDGDFTVKTLRLVKREEGKGKREVDDSARRFMPQGAIWESVTSRTAASRRLKSPSQNCRPAKI